MLRYWENIQMKKENENFLNIVQNDKLEAFFGMKYVAETKLKKQSDGKYVLAIYCSNNGDFLVNPETQAVAKYEATDFTMKQVGAGIDNTHQLGLDQSWQAYLLAKHERTGDKSYGEALVKEHAKNLHSMDKRFTDLIDDLHGELAKIREMESDFSKKLHVQEMQESSM